MTPQEKVLYHQIHPLKLLTGISVSAISLCLFWKRKLVAGLLVLFPDLVVSLLTMRWVDLEPYKHSALGTYLRTSMTPSVVAVRIVGTSIMWVGAWYRRPLLLPLGLGLVLVGWSRGVLWPKQPAEAKARGKRS